MHPISDKTKNDEVDKFPISTDLIKEQENIARFWGHSLTKVYYTSMDHLRVYIGANIEADDRLKDLVLSGIVFAFAFTYTFDDIRRFQTDRLDPLGRLVEHLISGKDTGQDVRTIAAASKLTLLTCISDENLLGGKETLFDEWQNDEDRLTEIKEYRRLIEQDPRFEKLAVASKRLYERAIAALAVPSDEGVRDNLTPSKDIQLKL